MDTYLLNYLEQASASVLSFLQHQVIYSTILFVAIAILAFVLRKNSAYWQLGLWSLILLRLVLPTDLGTPWSARSLIDHIPFSNIAPTVDIPRVPVSMERRDVSGLYEDQNTGRLEAGLGNVGKGQSARRVFLTWQMILFSAWLIGMIALSSLYVRQLLKYYRLTGRAAEVQDKKLLEAIEKWRNKFGIKQPVRLVFSDDFLSPFTLGIFCPAIFIPSQLIESEDQEILELFIAHEMAHIRRFDDFWIKIQQMIQIVFFFHPVAWYANRQINQARERLCDQRVLEEGVPSKSYGQSMLKVLQNNLFGGVRVDVLPGFGNQQKQTVQMQDIIAGGNMKKTSTIFITCILVILGLVLLPMASPSTDTDNSSNRVTQGEKGAVTLPKDIEKFIDDYTNATLSHNLEKIAESISEDFMFNGLTKRNVINYMQLGIDRLIPYEILLTEFELKGNIAVVEGFIKTNLGKRRLPEMMLIKENGQWKWFGDQKGPLFFPIAETDNDNSVNRVKKVGKGTENLPKDIEKFIEDYINARLNHNLEKIAEFFSENFLYSGINKHTIMTGLENTTKRLTFFEFLLTKYYELKANIAVVDGFSKTNLGKIPWQEMMVIKENGKWKWHGNQKEGFRPYPETDNDEFINRVNEDEKRAVNLPKDIEKFIDDYTSAWLIHDLEKIAEFFSEDFMFKGHTKRNLIDYIKQGFYRLTPFEIVLTEIELKENIAVVYGYIEDNLGKRPLTEMMLIKEDEQWKFYGNQKRRWNFPIDRERFYKKYSLTSKPDFLPFKHLE